MKILQGLMEPTLSPNLSSITLFTVGKWTWFKVWGIELEDSKGKFGKRQSHLR